MLVAPTTLPAASASPLHRRRAGTRRTRLAAAHARAAAPSMWASIAAGVWFAVGIACLIAVPATRGGAWLGATLPFWLIVAPLLDLAWLQRTAIARALRRRSQSVLVRLAAARLRRPRRHWRR